jgi:hypothetical protein
MNQNLTQQILSFLVVHCPSLAWIGQQLIRLTACDNLANILHRWHETNQQLKLASEYKRHKNLRGGYDCLSMVLLPIGQRFTKLQLLNQGMY